MTLRCYDCDGWLYLIRGMCYWYFWGVVVDYGTDWLLFVPVVPFPMSFHVFPVMNVSSLLSSWLMSVLDIYHQFTRY